MGGFQAWFPAGAALLTFLLTASLAFGAGVSFVTLLVRSFFAALVIGVLSYGILWYVVHVVAGLDHQAVGHDQDLSWGETGLDDDRTYGMTKEASSSFRQNERGFIPGQIDPGIEDLVERDPARAAEIMRKMQWEDGQ